MTNPKSRIVQRLFTNGTSVLLGGDHVITVLSTGERIPAYPNSDSAAMAETLGYGDDVAAMTRHHDPLHTYLANLVHGGESHALRHVAGAQENGPLVWLEEQAVLALQAYAMATNPAFLENSVGGGPKQ